MSSTHATSLLSRPLLSFLSLLLLLLLTHPAATVAQTCNHNSCSPDQGSLPSYPPNSCDLCTLTGTCSTAYYSLPGFSCGNATLTVRGAITLRRAQCCPNSYDGESEYVCISEQHSEEDGIVDGFSCAKVGAMVSLLRTGMLVGASVCMLLFAVVSLCMWRCCVAVPDKQFVLPQYQQPLVEKAAPELPESSRSAAAYQPPTPQVPPLLEHRPQYDQLIEAGSQ